MIGSIQKRVFVFIDGQNLFRSAKEAFGYTYPNYDVKLLSEKVCLSREWILDKIYFYTGVPDVRDNNQWHNFWTKKLSYMGRRGIKIFSRDLRYHNEKMKCPSCGKTYTNLVGREKGVDIRIALDVIRFAHEKLYNVALIFSQDQDLSEVADEIRKIASEQQRWIKIASSFLISPTSRNRRGIDKTDWIEIDRHTYDSCIDPADYR